MSGSDLTPEGAGYDSELEAFLVEARPIAARPWADGLEQALIAGAHRRGRRRRAATVGSGAVALAAVALVVGLFGSGPLESGGGSPAQAGGRCTTIHVTEVQPVGQIVRRPDGQVVVESARQPVTKLVQRCR